MKEKNEKTGMKWNNDELYHEWINLEDETISGQNIIYLTCLGYVLDENKANEWPSIS